MTEDGTFGDAGVFSFYPSKIITTAEGGLITTNNDELAENVGWLETTEQEEMKENIKD